MFAFNWEKLEAAKKNKQVAAKKAAKNKKWKKLKRKPLKRSKLKCRKLQQRRGKKLLKNQKKKQRKKRKKAAENAKREKIEAAKKNKHVVEKEKKEIAEKEAVEKKLLKRIKLKCKKLEMVFDDGKGTIAHRKEMQSLAPGIEIEKHIIDTLLLNEEKDQAKEYESFENVINNQMNASGSKKKMKDVELTFFPTVAADGQYYVIVFNLLKANAVILDN
ncbi:hypothetical protein Tco_0536465 [Tanacetum coccineum]